VRTVRALLDADSALVHRGDRAGGTPLHRAVIGRAPKVVEMLLVRGADIHAVHGAGLGSSTGYAPEDLQPIDLAIWGGPGNVATLSAIAGFAFNWMDARFAKRRRPHDLKSARLLISRGAAYDLTIAAALGDIDRVTAILDKDATRITETRPNSRRPLTAAVEFGYERIVRLLLARGADPTWPDADDSPRGAALHAAARSRDVRGRTMRHRTECAAILLDAGAAISAKDAEYRSTPLAWAARNNLPDMVNFLLARGAPANLPDDEPWTTPLAWAERRGHAEIASTLRRQGAK
jgi:ankyrin repeat protein